MLLFTIKDISLVTKMVIWTVTAFSHQNDCIYATNIYVIRKVFFKVACVGVPLRGVPAIEIIFFILRNMTYMDMLCIALYESKYKYTLQFYV